MCVSASWGEKPKRHQCYELHKSQYLQTSCKHKPSAKICFLTRRESSALYKVPSSAFLCSRCHSIQELRSDLLQKDLPPWCPARGHGPKTHHVFVSSSCLPETPCLAVDRQRYLYFSKAVNPVSPANIKMSMKFPPPLLFIDQLASWGLCR